MKNHKSGIKKRILSFKYAFEGLFFIIMSEPNARLHIIATILVLAAGFFFHLSYLEWCSIIVIIALVWATEAFNTIIEKIIDHLFPEHNESAKIIKDISAGAVLICAIAALVIGLIIFLPKILNFTF